jgi:hypothetical protein
MPKSSSCHQSRTPLRPWEPFVRIGNTSWTSHPNRAFRKRPFVVINDTFQPTLCDSVGEREQPRNPVRPRRNIRPMGRDKLTDMKVMIHHVWQQLADGSDSAFHRN